MLRRGILAEMTAARILVLTLDLVVPGYDLSVARRRNALARAFARVVVASSVVARTWSGLRWWSRRRVRIVAASGTIVHPSCCRRRSIVTIVDEQVIATALGVGGSLVFVSRVGEFGDDVPRMKESRELRAGALVGCARGGRKRGRIDPGGAYVAKNAEEYVDK